MAEALRCGLVLRASAACPPGLIVNWRFDAVSQSLRLTSTTPRIAPRTCSPIHWNGLSPINARTRTRMHARTHAHPHSRARHTHTHNTHAGGRARTHTHSMNRGAQRVGAERRGLDLPMPSPYPAPLSRPRCPPTGAIKQRFCLVLPPVPRPRQRRVIWVPILVVAAQMATWHAAVPCCVYKQTITQV